MILRSITLATIASVAAAVSASAQSLEDPKMPRLDVFGGKRPTLGYEGTPLAKKKNEPVEQKPKGQTEIVALEATFDQKAHQAVFIGDVVVTDPEFVVHCDRMTAFLKHKDPPEAGAPKATAAKAPASPTPKAKEEPESKGGGLDHAIAEAARGKEVLITQDKIEADGSITKNIGRGKKATYDSTTGDIVLTGNPSVQQGINLCVSQSDDTVMTLNRNGKMHVVGAHTTVIKDTAAAASDTPR
jgi:lipopolysaccharide export system protein LptA